REKSSMKRTNREWMQRPRPITAPPQGSTAEATPCMTSSASIASTRRKQNTYEETGCQDAGTLPIIGLPALLRLADWISRKRQEATQGGAPCRPTGSDQIPPAHEQPSPQPSVKSPLAGAASPDTAASPAAPSSR